MPGENQAQVLPNNTLSEEIEAETGIKVSACYQCKKCTNGCPVTFAMDIYPDRVIRFIQLGQEDRVLNCNTIWICSACETCTTRCPNEVDIAGAMADIKRRGRVFEGGLVLSYMLRSGEFKRKLFKFDVGADIWLGWNMFKRGRMKLFPKGIKGKKEIKKLLK
ncbi:MAG: 4Fe-4S dicluster domain-containing protein [Deltaproteobacteria bacterium]|nr:4Fe-4S dicluster domain-containing protein [Deltaproteobacteria bacterium]